MTISKLRVVFFIFFILSAYIGSGQRYNGDSLRQVLKLGSIDNEERIKIWNTLTQLYKYTDTDSSIHFNTKAVDLAKSKNYENLYFKACSLQVVLNYQIGEDSIAKRLNNQLIMAAKEANKTSFLASFHLQRASIHYYSNELDSSLYYLEEGLPFAKNNPKQQMKFYGNMAASHTGNNNMPQAIELHFKALKIADYNGLR